MARVRSSDGIELAYEVHGKVRDRPALVLVHGWAGNRAYWTGQTAALAADRLVITLDLGGPAGADPALVRRVATDMAAEPWDATQGSISRALNREPALLSTLADLTLPVVAINPDIGPTDVASLRAHGIESVVVVPGVGHFLMLEQPDQFSVLLNEALDSIDGPPLLSSS